jgi:hypothetical protein
MTAGYYPIIPVREDWLERRIRALEQQVLELQAGRKLAAASFRGGAFRFLDDEGDPRHVLGNVELSGEIGGELTAYGDFMYGDEGAIILGGREGDRGLMYPPVPQPLTDPTAKVITTGTFTTQWEGRLDFPAHEVFYVSGAAATDAGTVAEIRLHEGFTNTNTSPATVASGASITYQFGWLGPWTTGLYDPRDRDTSSGFMAVQARRVSGSGSLFIWPPQTAVWTSRFLIPSADTSGAPSP